MRELSLDEQGNLVGIALVAEKETRNGWKVRREDLAKIAETMWIQQIIFNELPDTTCHPSLAFASARMVSVEVQGDCIVVKAKPLPTGTVPGYRGGMFLEQIIRENTMKHFCFTVNLMGHVDPDGYAKDPGPVATCVTRRDRVED